MATKLRKYKYLNLLFRSYDRFMKHTGLFFLKRKVNKRFFLRKLEQEDAALKRQIAQKIEQLPVDILHRNNDESDVIVSLTSYGRRVIDSAPYAIYSIFTQSALPNRIVLWLDNDNWNEDNLPYLLKRLQKSGLEIYFCSDIKSYKKLIPSLKMFPDNYIVVIDDDFYYNKDFVKWLVDAYNNSDKHTVFATWGRIVGKKGGKFLPYTQWKDCKYGDENSVYSLYGGGAGYPPKIFDEEIFREDIFMKLCPTADDIWFWVQEIRMGVKTRLTTNHGHGLHRPVDRISEYDISGALTKINDFGGQNDVQLRNLLEYYHLGEMTE